MSAVIEQILQTKSIVSYLESHGHTPVREFSGRSMYLCPLPGHNESKPSFVVWTNSEYENFFCFGCTKHSNIIHLVSYMESISFRDAVKLLSDGMEITSEDEILSALNSFEKKYQENKQPFAPVQDLSFTLFSISSLCRSYLQSVDFNEAETVIIDKLWENVDSDLLNYKFEDIDETLQSLPRILQGRKTQFDQKQTQETMMRSLL